jgi:hypothetical protein
MKKFRNEYEKLHKALKMAYESEKSLVKKYVKGQPGQKFVTRTYYFILTINSNLNF